MDTREATVTGGRMVTGELAERVARLGFEDLPDAVVEEVGRAPTDFLGECLFVGASQPWGRSIAALAAAEGGPGEATVIATGDRTSASKAALANGTMARAGGPLLRPAKITVHPDDELFTKSRDTMPGTVTERTTDGRELRAEVHHPKGNARDRMTEDELRGRFMQLAERVPGESRAAELYDRARRVRDIDDMDELSPLLSSVT